MTTPVASARGGSEGLNLSARTGIARILARTCRIAAVTLGFITAGAALQAQPATGRVEGRVQNALSGASLETARVSVKGTSLVTLTDAGGVYRLTDVPAGSVTLRVFYTGLDEQEVTVDVPAGGIAQKDFSLTSKARYGADADTVKLDAFIVQSKKETDAAMIAVNEQRFARNQISVVSADEYGSILDNNPGELLKNLPGMDVEYFGGTIVAVSTRGLGSENTEITFDGMPAASANVEGSSSGTNVNANRGFEVQHMNAADIARVEVRKVPLPEDSADALGGSVNMIRRSAFEKSRREISYMASFVSDGDYLTTKKMDGPKDRLQSRWRPNWRVTWTEPLTKDLGFALTVGQMDQVTNVRWSSGSWNTGSSANFLAHKALIAAGQPLTQVPSLFNPALSQIALSNAPYGRGQDYVSFKADWRPRRELTLSWSVAYNDAWKEEIEETRFRLNAAATGSGNVTRENDPSHSFGRVGGGAVREENPKWRDQYSPQLNTAVTGEWKRNNLTLGAKASFAQTKHFYKDMEDGFFEQTSAYGTTDSGMPSINHLGFGSGTANPIPLTIDFYNPGYWITADKIVVRTTPAGLANSQVAGAVQGAPSTNINDYTVPLDWKDLSLWRIGGATSRPGHAKSIVTAAKLYGKYDFNFRNPFSIKAGVDLQEDFRNREYNYRVWRYVGADGIPESPDDNALPIMYSSAGPRPDPDYGFDTPPRVSMSKLYDLYVAHPTWFAFDEERTLTGSLRTQRAFEMTEKTVAPYVQLNWRGFNNRLQLTGGMRREMLDARGKALLTERANAYMKYSDGTPVRLNDKDAAGNALVINRGTATAVNYQLVFAPTVLPSVRSGAPIFTPEIQAAGNALRAAGKSTNSGTNLGLGTLAYTNAVYKRMGAVGHGKLERNFPSLHATYSITENLDLQFAYAQTTSRPNLQNVVLPSDDYSDDPVTVSGEQALGRITLTNPDLKPTDCDTYDIRLAYYTKSGGSWAFGLYRKNFQNFFTSTDTEPLTAEELAAWQAAYPEKDLGPEYVGYSIRTNANTGSARMEGAEFEGRQTLDTILPHWARGFRIGGSIAYANRKVPNRSLNGLQGTSSSILGRDRTWRGAANLNYASRKFSAAVKYQMNGDWIENDSLTDNNAPGVMGRQVILRQDVIDLEASYRITKWAELFATAGNVTGELRVREQQMPGRPKVGSMTSSSSLGKSYSIGVKGTF